MEIKELDKKEYKGFSLEFKYKTKFYYDILLSADEMFSVKLVKKELEKELDKQFTSNLYEDYFEDSKAFSLTTNREILGYLEIDKEKWNNRLRIINILILNEFRRNGYGTLLINKAKDIAINEGYRQVILEIQSCNYKAINFYIKNGFNVNGIDLSCYSNSDVEKREVRVEMTFKI